MTPATVSNIAHRAVPIKAGVFEIIRSATPTNSATRSLGRLWAPVLLIALLAVALSAPPLAAQAPPDPESIATFAADCTTPQIDFNLGETVCAKLTGAPLGPPVQRAIHWTGPFRLIVSSANVVTDPQTELFTIPAPAASVVNGETVDNRGTWSVSDTTASDASLQARALFTVHDPAEPVADLVIYSSISVADSDVSVGGNNTSGNLTSTLYVANRGPDAAATVQATEPVPVDTTFSSLTQDSGPAFTCTTGAGTITCTIPSLAKDDAALFTVVYNVTAATPNISLTANASTTTTERDNSDNATTPLTPAPGGGGGGACTTPISCPANIAQNGDTTNEQGVFGALVTFNTPASSCGTVNCDPSSGSFFPVGATDVTCSDGADNSCLFTVTVNDTRAVVITLNGNNPMTVECHGSFMDPGATAKDGSGFSVPVTTSGTVNANVPGSYTITYTATSGPNTATATRTVNVVDTTPPTITLLGADPMTVVCHTSFTDPGATAADTCAGDLTSQIVRTGSVDVNTPGTDTLTYTVGDGETIASITRTVNVVDMQLAALGPAQVWVGLKNSDDVGTKFDLLTEVLKNGALVGSGQLNDVPGGSSGFNNAILHTINLALSGPVGFCAGDTLSIRLSVRVAASSGHRSGTARLWFNDTAATSRFSATIDGTTNDYFLLSAFALGTAAGPGPKNRVDVHVDRAIGGNPFKPFGTWSTLF